MTFAAWLLAACVAAELAAFGLAVVVLARQTRTSPKTFGGSTAQEGPQVAGSFAFLWGLGCRIWAWLQRAGSVAKAASKSTLVKLLAFAVLVDVAVALLAPVAASGPRPRTLGPWLALHLSYALTMGWAGAVSWAAWQLFAKTGNFSRPIPEAATERESGNGPYRASAREHLSTWRAPSPLRVLAGSYVLAVVSLAALPLSRVWVARTLHAFELGAVAVTWLAVRRGWGPRTWRVEHRALVVLVSFETIVATVGPFAGDVFASWPVVGCGLYLLAFGSVAGVLGWEIRRRA